MASSRVARSRAVPLVRGTGTKAGSPPQSTVLLHLSGVHIWRFHLWPSPAHDFMTLRSSVPSVLSCTAAFPVSCLSRPTAARRLCLAATEAERECRSEERPRRPWIWPGWPPTSSTCRVPLLAAKHARSVAETGSDFLGTDSPAKADGPRARGLRNDASGKRVQERIPSLRHDKIYLQTRSSFCVGIELREPHASGQAGPTAGDAQQTPDPEKPCAEGSRSADHNRRRPSALARCRPPRQRSDNQASQDCRRPVCRR